MSIRTLFDPNTPIDRPIEKVITFSNRRPEILFREAREYVVTDNLAKEYEKLLGHFERSQDGDDDFEECCVWLSGFYGSGKSSFAKYFGMTFDPDASEKDKHFAEEFLKQFPNQPFRQRVAMTRKKFNVTVFLLDLASEARSGVTHEPISTLLFDKVCNWAGFSSDRKISQLESFLDKDGKLEEFRQSVESESGFPYEELDPTLLMPIASDLAHKFYPAIWKTEDTFLNTHTINTQTERERVQEMVDLIERKTGSKRVLFIVDEVGHFLRNNDSLINNLDGLAKNLKEVGHGMAWLMATAQETLPNTGALFGLRDRFPIKIDLKPSDIREITHRRLLKKSVEGEKALKAHFATDGQKLTHLTKLEDFTTTDDFTTDTFTDFYPLLPQSFDVLIQAIRSLAKLQGGIGLRSAIRCVQDILINSQSGRQPIIEQEVPTLLTSADLYDVLASDLSQAAREIVLHIDRVSHTHGLDSWELKVAKSIAILEVDPKVRPVEGSAKRW
ncbi:hypothetical protein [Roseibacillus ishigakijimensis]|uniref:BREX system P-loop protein BrxC n=1 Tax=Roseibacillus ishigakijimensis TaxID=454146 RepID=A0A934RSB4_9BACT|nr:hypothetical protein [Roseibacillus ishigakijimensis]MBK1834746.1 hypothetical protein [Roseibacillus ishigakijimensis]